MFFSNIEKYKIILASQSPRRQYLLKELGVEFDVKMRFDVDESYPKELKADKIAFYLAKKKADAFIDLKDNEILITADTIVWHEGTALNKPENKTEAINVLQRLSGKCHQVYTGVSIKSIHKEVTFVSSTDVYFKNLTSDEINYYVEHYQPFDKAGAYGIQEWIGYIGVEKIHGSYFNVMGLPVQKLYHELTNFINQ